MIETKIYVGLNDSKTKTQRRGTETYVGILKNVCRSYEVPFSFAVVQGGYLHADGSYTEENTLVLSLIDAEETKIDEIAKDLCVSRPHFGHLHASICLPPFVDASGVLRSARRCSGRSRAG